MESEKMEVKKLEFEDRVENSINSLSPCVICVKNIQYIIASF